MRGAITTLAFFSLVSCFGHSSRAVSQTTSFWDKVVFKTVKQTLGGNLKILISGSSQISSTVLNFMRSSFGCLVNTEHKRSRALDSTECLESLESLESQFVSIYCQNSTFKSKLLIKINNWRLSYQLSSANSMLDIRLFFFIGH